MAKEAAIIELLGTPPGCPIRFTVADGTAITKGAILKMTDPRTAIISSGTGDVIAGIAAVDKVANDGQTSIPVYTNGIFDLECGAIATATLGTFVRSEAGTVANTVVVSTTLDQETGKAIGRALETGSNGEVIAVRVLL